MRRRHPIIAILAMLSVAGCSGSPAASGPADSPLASPTSPSVASPSTNAPQPSVAATPSASTAVIRLTAVGDSIPYGQTDCNGCKPFPELFGEWIGSTTGATVDVANLSQHDNNTAARMAIELPKRKALEDRLAISDVIILSIGHNDTPWNATDDACDANHGFFDGNANASWNVLVGSCLQTEVDRYRKNLTTILDTIVVLRAGKPTTYRLLMQYSDIAGDPCCPAEATTVAATVKDAFNKAACEVGATGGFVCVDVYHAFNGPKGTDAPGELLASDHTHPSSAGHQKIAELLEAAGLAPIR
jgi:lysophospholipase L1-like esterase